jgi:excisionase family DNA binding protein
MQRNGRIAEIVETTTAKPTERVWMSREQAANYTGLDKVTLWRAVRAGKLRAGGYGRAVRFERVELDRFMRGDTDE